MKYVYLAGDIDGDEMIGFDEYILLFRHMEPSFYSFLTATNFFYNNCDLVDELSGEKNMTFAKFAFCSVESNMFSRET